MRLHTNYHNHSTIAAALASSGLVADGVRLAECSERGSRSTGRAYEVRLNAEPGRDRNGKARRRANSGSYGAAHGADKAATYEEWGYFIAELYADETGMRFGPYADAVDFRVQTCYAFDVPTRPAARECLSRCVDTCVYTGRGECGRAA